MSFQHPYPDHAYLERDSETNEKRWYGTKGMGVAYVHEDRAAEDIAAAIAAEREACAKIAESGEPRELMMDDGTPIDDMTARAVQDYIAELIRARSATSK